MWSSHQEKTAGLVRPLTKNHDFCLFIGCWSLDLDVFICLHKGAPCISVEVEETGNLTESHYACTMILFVILLS